jgi:uncharacterized protein
MFEWDENKRLITIEKRKIDFRDMVEIFLSQHLVLDARSEIEQRRIAVGKLNESYFAVIFTMRGETHRIITARKARRDEREQYQALYAGRSQADKE